MDTQKALEAAGNLVTEWAINTEQPDPNRLDVIMEPGNLPAATEALHKACWGYLVTITGLDKGLDEDCFEALYHFCSDNAVVTLRVQIPKADPSVPTICSVIPSASLVERELSEMFGITVVNTPDPSHLFLPDSWPDEQYPLRKDFSAENLELAEQAACETKA